MKIINLVLNNFVNDSRVLKTSISLMSFGYDVQVVALHEHGLNEHEKVCGVDVHRVKLQSRAWSKHRAVQLIKLFEFVLRFIISYRKADVIHCNDLNGLVVGAFCKCFRWKLKLVYDSHEFAINDVPNQSKLSIKLKYFLEWYFIRFAEQVICVSDSIANEYARLYSIKKPYLVLNCPVYQEPIKHDIFRQELNIRSDQKIFLYQGGLSKGRGIEILLEAFSNLETDENVLVCMGYGPLESIIQEEANKQTTIYFYPAVRPEVLLNYTSSADYGILFYEDSCLNHRYCSPNKIFEYLMAGLPVLTSNLYEMRRLVQETGVGIVASDNTVLGFSQAVKKSIALDYQQLQEHVFDARKKYCWEEQEKMLREIYDSI